uniref:Uncharacterized protein n=1 Tax=Phlebotomus papatasi TaxID=29031 RepID=A0A1B0D330_PHLPP
MLGNIDQEYEMLPENRKKNNNEYIEEWPPTIRGFLKILSFFPSDRKQTGIFLPKKKPSLAAVSAAGKFLLNAIFYLLPLQHPRHPAKETDGKQMERN